MGDPEQRDERAEEMKRYLVNVAHLIPPISTMFHEFIKEYRSLGYGRKDAIYLAIQSIDWMSSGRPNARAKP